MIENNSPGKARASPERADQTPKLSGRARKRFRNPRFEQGGERFVWDTIDIVHEEPITSDPEQGDNPSPPEIFPAKKWEISMNMIFQLLTLVVAISALIVAILAV